MLSNTPLSHEKKETQKEVNIPASPVEKRELELIKEYFSNLPDNSQVEDLYASKMTNKVYDFLERAEEYKQLEMLKYDISQKTETYFEEMLKLAADISILSQRKKVR